MKNEDLTSEGFARLLLWLDVDREQAALKYEKIRGRLIKVFEGRGCGNDAGDLADRTIDRVTRKLNAGDIPEPYVGDKAIYFVSFVNNICHEYFRECKRQKIPRQPVNHEDDFEEYYDYFEQCMMQLNAEERRLVIEYYRFDKTAKIERRRQLARELGIDVQVLRLRAYRIRKRLRRLIEDCRASRRSCSQTFGLDRTNFKFPSWGIPRNRYSLVE